MLFTSKESYRHQLILSLPTVVDTGQPKIVEGFHLIFPPLVTVGRLVHSHFLQLLSPISHPPRELRYKPYEKSKTVNTNVHQINYSNTLIKFVSMVYFNT